MRKIFILLFVFVVATAPFATTGVSAHDNHAHDAAELPCDQNALHCPAASANELERMLGSFPAPDVTPPPSPIATLSFNISKPLAKTVTYDIATRGSVTADLNTFKAQVHETFNDARGWRRLGAAFNEVPSGGDFTIVLAEASQVPTFWSGCSSEWSCAVGRYVVINQDRWQGASAAWNAAGADLRNYRHMVINHETGHWLGHGHQNCGGAGQGAAVMQQQSVDLQGCKFNPWPLDSEIWSTKLGIRQ